MSLPPHIKAAMRTDELLRAENKALRSALSELVEAAEAEAAYIKKLDMSEVGPYVFGDIASDIREFLAAAKSLLDGGKE